MRIVLMFLAMMLVHPVFAQSKKLHPNGRDCVKQSYAKVIGNGTYVELGFENICDESMSVLLTKGNGKVIGSGLAPGSPASPSKMSINCTIADGCDHRSSWRTN